MKKIIPFVAVLLVISAACKKNELGGKSTIKGTVNHHTKPIPFARVFIKFNAKEFPGEDTTLYDAKFTTGADAAYSFNCYKGNYFLYGYGFDPGVPGVVTGGVHVKLRTNEDKSLDVPVTED